MIAGLLHLLSKVEQHDLEAFFETLPYDELIEFSPEADSFKSLFHVSKKYSLPLSEGSFGDLSRHMKNVLVHPEDRERLSAFLDPVTLHERLEKSQLPGALSEEFRLKLFAGGWRWTDVILLGGECTDGMRFRMYFFDVTSRKNRETGLSGEFYTGPENRNELTGLLKKSAFTRGAELLMAERDETWCFVAMDIENFKLFNEWYGHDKGNSLMIQIGAKLLEERKQLGGLAGYFGQDDFCLLMPYDKDRVQKLYDEISAIISDAGNTGGFMPAFGVALSDGRTTVRNLLDRAFLAARFAKEKYHSRIRVFERSMYLQTEEEYKIMNEFLTAMKNHEITFYLQPQCRSSSGKIVGAEALARWIKPDGSMMSPLQFIPALEKHGLITDLDQYIWEEVCRWLGQRIKAGKEPLSVSVNVSQMDIVSVDLADYFTALADKYEVPYKLLKIEITESAYSSNATLVTETVQRLRDRGFLVMMDDFGNGYSSLNMLRSLNIDVIKLDGNFLTMSKSDEIKGIHILESIVNMTKALGIPIIVEGVETEAQKQFLDGLGCRYVQGYYFYRPMSVANFEKIISDPERIDLSGVFFKANQQFRLRELLDDNVYSDSMLNNILGPCAFYAVNGNDVDIVRFNEQFYRAVGVPDFSERLCSIQQYMPEADRAPFIAAFEHAELDRLNGGSGVFHFYRTDGSLSAFYIRMYFLRTDMGVSGVTKLFYGSAQDITRLMNLENQMSLLSRYSPYTVVFLTLEPHREFKVLFHGLSPVIGFDAKKLEQQMNSYAFFDRVSPEYRERFQSGVVDRLNRRESFVVRIGFITEAGRTINLIIYSDYVCDEATRIDYIITIRDDDIEMLG